MTVFTGMLTCCCQKNHRKQGKSWPIGKGKAALRLLPSLIYVNIIHIYINITCFLRVFLRSSQGKFYAAM